MWLTTIRKENQMPEEVKEQCDRVMKAMRNASLARMMKGPSVTETSLIFKRSALEFSFNRIAVCRSTKTVSPTRKFGKGRLRRASKSALYRLCPFHLAEGAALSGSCTFGISEKTMGLVPTLLVFGIVPPFPLGFSDLPVQRTRMEALHKARREMAKAVATARLRAALSGNFPAAADRDIRIGSKVLCYEEKEKMWCYGRDRTHHRRKYYFAILFVQLATITPGQAPATFE